MEKMDHDFYMTLHTYLGCFDCIWSGPGRGREPCCAKEDWTRGETWTKGQIMSSGCGRRLRMDIAHRRGWDEADLKL